MTRPGGVDRYEAPNYLAKYRERQKILNARILADFQMIDYFLITGAVESAQTGLI